MTSRPSAGRPVLVLHDALSETGSVRWVNALAGRWAASGLPAALFVLLDRPRGTEAVPPDGVPVTWGGRRGQRLRRALPRALPGLVAAVARSRLVLVPSEVGISVPLGYLAARAMRRPYVVLVQSVLERSVTAWVPRWRRRAWLGCIRRADAVVCVSPGGAESVLRLGVPAARVTVAPAGIDVDEVVRRGHDPPAVVAGGDRPVLVACGELSVAKGYDLLIRALAEVRARGHHTARLVILGEGGERAALERLAADLGVGDAVELPGFVADPYPEMRAADLFCLSSVFEGFPLCVLEALALGVPIVAADADGGGPRLLLDGGRLGALVRPRSAEALADAIIAHLERPELQRARAAGGADHVRRFTPSAAAGVMAGIFDRVVPERSGD